MTKIVYPVLEIPSGAAESLGHALGLSPAKPFPFALGATSLRLRRLREQRAQEKVVPAVHSTAC